MIIREEDEETDEDNQDIRPMSQDRKQPHSMETIQYTRSAIIRTQTGE